MPRDSKYFSSSKKGTPTSYVLTHSLYFNVSNIGEVAEWRQDLKTSDKVLLKTTVKRSMYIDIFSVVD